MVGVLALEVANEAEANAIEAKTVALTERIEYAKQTNDAAGEAMAQKELEALAPPLGFLVLRKGAGGKLSGAKELNKDDIVASSAYVNGIQEVSSLAPGPPAKAGPEPAGA